MSEDLEWDAAAEEVVHRAESGSYMAEVREYPSGGFMLHVEFDVFNLSQGKVLAERIFKLVNEIMGYDGEVSK